MVVSKLEILNKLQTLIKPFIVLVKAKFIGINIKSIIPGETIKLLLKNQLVKNKNITTIKTMTISWKITS